MIVRRKLFSSRSYCLFDKKESVREYDIREKIFFNEEEYRYEKEVEKEEISFSKFVKSNLKYPKSPVFSLSQDTMAFKTMTKQRRNNLKSILFYSQSIISRSGADISGLKLTGLSLWGKPIYENKTMFIDFEFSEGIKKYEIPKETIQVDLDTKEITVRHGKSEEEINKLLSPYETKQPKAKKSSGFGGFLRDLFK